MASSKRRAETVGQGGLQNCSVLPEDLKGSPPARPQGGRWPRRDPGPLTRQRMKPTQSHTRTRPVWSQRLQQKSTHQHGIAIAALTSKTLPFSEGKRKDGDFLTGFITRGFTPKAEAKGSQNFSSRRGCPSSS